MTNEINDSRARDHMANERTFLAWIRTNIGIIAFGFVIEKFGLFMKQMGLILGKGSLQTLPVSQGYSELMGILIVGFGTMLSLLAYINFKRVEKQIQQGTSAYLPSGAMYSLLATTIIALGVFLMIYLVQNTNPGTHA
jgi:putative membrane protein